MKPDLAETVRSIESLGDLDALSDETLRELVTGCNSAVWDLEQKTFVATDPELRAWRKHLVRVESWARAVLSERASMKGAA